MVLAKAEDAFKVPRSMLLTSGLWPIENKSLWYKLRRATSWAAILGLCLTMWMEFFNDIHDLTKLAAISYILVSFLNAIAKQIGLTSNYKLLQETLTHLKNPIFTAHPEDLDHYMARTIKFSTLLANTYRNLIGFGVFLIGLFPIIDNKPLPFPFPYDIGDYRFLMYTFQLLCEVISAWNHACLDTICLSLMDIASAQLDILAEKIIRIKVEVEFHEDGEKRDGAVIKQLKHCIDHHLAIIKFIENIENIFGLGFSAQYLASSLILCITIFCFISLPLSFQFAVLVDYLIVVMMQLFIYCWYGDQILTKVRTPLKLYLLCVFVCYQKSLQIGDACYTFNWYYYGIPVRKYIFIIMERSKRHISITALKLTTISLITLTTILNKAYSMLTVLINMNKKE